MKTTAAKTAKAIRDDLKLAGIKAKVHSMNYSGGNSVWVVLDEEYESRCEEIADSLKKYQMGEFDGMNDTYVFDNMRNDVPQVKYVLVN